MNNTAMLSLLTDKDGNMVNDLDKVLKALAKMKKVEKAESLRRRTEAVRRKQFCDVGVSVKVSYESMTSFVWEFAMSHMDEMRSWMQNQYPDKFATVSGGEIQGDVQEKGMVETQC